MADLKLALRLLLRDWRAGELRILAIALVVAVTSVTSVGFFADRVRQALVRDAHQLLGADLVLIAADTGVDRGRFAGKRVYATTTKAAIRDGKGLIATALKDAELQGAPATEAGPARPAPGILRSGVRGGELRVVSSPALRQLVAMRNNPSPRRARALIAAAAALWTIDAGAPGPAFAAPADNPAVDVDAPGRLVHWLTTRGAEYVSERGLPYGAAVEAMTADALRRAGDA